MNGCENNQKVETKIDELSSEKSMIDATGDSITAAPKMSKKQLKRLKRSEQWMANKEERKKRDKEKRKAKIARAKEAGVPLVTRKMIKQSLVSREESSCKVALVIDCDYEQLMNQLEMKKLCKQLNRCYYLNRHSSVPVQFYLTSVKGQILENLEHYQRGYKQWDIVCTDLHWTEVFRDASTGELKPNIIYLSGDSPVISPDPKTIQTENHHIFIIGGLIDHNRHKGMALGRAETARVAHAQLPLDAHIKMAQRKVLAIPHVFEIMLYAANGTEGDRWTDIFHKVIPGRKVENTQN